MSPEAPGNLVVVDAWMSDDRLLARVERAETQGRSLDVSWYGTEPPENSLTMGQGVVYVYDADEIEVKILPEAVIQLHRNDDEIRYFWRDKARGDGLMFVLILPPGYTLLEPIPMLREAKSFQDRIAVYWKPEGLFGTDVKIEWCLTEIDDELDAAVNLINHLVLDAEQVPTNPGVSVSDLEEWNLEAKRALFSLLVDLFSASELDTLCFQLGIDRDSLEPGPKEVKAREIIIYLDRRQRLNDLSGLCSQLRPGAGWPTFS